MEDFLRKRNVDEEVIRLFQDEKIDEHVVLEMSDEQIKDLGLKFGDRVALRTFVKTKFENQQSSGANSNAKNLLERIKERISKRKPGNSRKCWKSLQGNINAQKLLRRVEIGWLMKSSSGVRQVRLRKGGGTRHVKFAGSDTIQMVKERATELFFPDGRSQVHGHVQDYDISMTNFDTSDVDRNKTVQELYGDCQLKLLRLYMLTTPKQKRHTSVEVGLTDSEESLPDLDSQPADETHVGASGDSQPFPDLLLFPDELVGNTETKLDTIDAPGMNSTIGNRDFTFLDEDIALSVGNNYIVDDTSLIQELDTTLPTEEVTLKLHRGHVLDEFENFFMENSFDMRRQYLKVQMILPNGALETAEDSGGVLRDALSEYWQTFYIKRTMGNKLKVPALSHAVNGKRWQASAKIISIGYYFEKYYPTEIASCFLEYAANGDHIPKETLLAQYMQYVPDSERDLIHLCLHDYDKLDQDELMDFLTDHKISNVPSKENIQKLIEDTAHKELLQCPTYVADCWREELQQMKSLLPKQFVEMNSFQPTFKEVWKTLNFSDGVEEKEIIAYLKRYLKEISVEELKDFLRFCTGADILLGKKIAVRFINADSEFSRRPIAHTCGCVLEVPKSYTSYVDLRNDFTAILKAGVWAMDIV